MISCKIIKDSINSVTNDRLTTFVITFPRFVNAEILRHRMLSFSSASTRAIPTLKIIKDVLDNPAIPVFWGKNQSGMQSFEELDDVSPSHYCNYDKNGNIFTDYLEDRSVTEREKAKRTWLHWSKKVCEGAQELLDCGLHKQYAGRILEFCQNITLIISGTEFQNFFALRDHKAAQPELGEAAHMALECYNASIPTVVDPVGSFIDFKFISDQKKLEYYSSMNKWHIPFSDKMPESLSNSDKIKIATARCARISYMTFDGEINAQKDLTLFSNLVESNPPHMSAAEHIAFPVTDSKFFGNMKGWVQLRKLYRNENSKDPRVIVRRVVDGVVV